MKRIALIFAVLIVLAYLDVVVVERIYKVMLGANINSQTIVTWLRCFELAAPVVFGLVALAGKDRFILVAGEILFLTGTEDILYYALQLQFPPASLEWLDLNPFISWTRIITRTQDVTLIGLIINILLSVLLCLFLAVLFKKTSRVFKRLLKNE